MFQAFDQKLWQILILFLTFFISKAFTENLKPEVEISVPSTHTTLSGDVLVRMKSSSSTPLFLQLSRLDGNSVQPITNFSFIAESYSLNKTSTIITIPCGFFSRSGKYFVMVRKHQQFSESSSESMDSDADDTNFITTESIDVEWPMPHVEIIPDHIQTYPKHPVVAALKFPEATCPPVSEYLPAAIPEFWLELHYCGHSPSTCDVFTRNNRSNQVLYSEQVRGFPGLQNITLQCKYFGLAGHYALMLRPTSSNSWSSFKAVYAKAEWSEEFVFNVHAQSIFPCDNHDGGITVLFQYPACILLTGDRVRLFARNRAEVAALIPPTSLEYVAEQKVLRGSNKLKFDCDLFSERYIEYCFVYVSQAITGAVADVRMDCVSTLPVRDTRSGGWGPWSSWTPCSTSCISGTRSRYRLCDSPIPKFGGKYCEGQAVETERCGTETGNVWECINGNFDQLDNDVTEVKEEVGLYCRCGCVVHLGRANPKRILATSSQSCPGRIFWQIQADSDCIIQFRLEWFDSSCGLQWLKVRDGMSLSSNLIADYSVTLRSRPSIVNSTESTMLLEFFSEESIPNGQQCGGGFLAYARQLENFETGTYGEHRSRGPSPFIILKLTAVHSTSIFFLSGTLIALALLGAQYTFRYRKYHIAFTEDQDSTVDISASCASLTSRRSSNATLFSEVLSMHPLQRHTVESHPNERISLSQADQKSLATLCRQQNSTDEDMKKSEIKSIPSPNEDINIEPEQERASSSINESDFKANDNSTSTETIEIEGQRRLSDTSVPAAAKGHYSSSRRVISTATIRTTIPKEAKEKKNRERLLEGPSGSDFSISGPEIDLEIDYYDYNVRNAGAAPGSYLGMDPAFLVYIPPFYESEDGSIEDGVDKQIEVEDEGKVTSSQETLHFEKDKEDSHIESCSKDFEKLVEDGNKRNYKTNEISCTISESQPVFYESKFARMHLQEVPKTCDNRKSSRRKTEEFSMIDSNILEEIKYVDDDEDERQ